MNTPVTEALPRIGRALVCTLVLAISPSAAAASWTLDASTWARPRTGTEILAMEPLPDVVQAWSRQPSDRIVVHHPGGEQGEVWATELRDWLVALGVPGSRVELVGGGEPQQLRIAVR